MEVKMSDMVAELESKIRALSPEERVELIRSLIADLDGPSDANIEKAWLQEAQKRYREITGGKVETVPGEQVFESLRSRLKNPAR
jgi:putative addiction module component (TIGR02574 family)